MITYYSRSVDAGAGRQIVEVKNGVIVKQYLNARQGYYSGSGNPELVGQPKSQLWKQGFRHVAGPQVFDALINRWISVDVDNDNEETESD